MFAAAGEKSIKIESIPPGADVYVMGEKVGETPFQISRDKVFPHLYPREKESLYGKVTLRKPGCLDFTRTISTDIGNYGLHAQLDCGDTYSSPSAAHVSAPPASETVEQRLDKIKELQSKGLITEDRLRAIKAGADIRFNVDICQLEGIVWDRKRRKGVLFVCEIFR